VNQSSHAALSPVLHLAFPFHQCREARAGHARENIARWSGHLVRHSFKIWGYDAPKPLVAKN